MSKMSNIAMELDERAVELGFADHLEALGNGYEWGVRQDGEAFLFKPEDEQEKAHEAWLKEKEEVIAGLRDCYLHLHGFPPEVYSKILNAIRFIEEVKSE